LAFSLAVVVILGLGGDYLFRRLKLPGLVGMLLVGILVGPYVLGLLAPDMMTVSADFRKIALIVILLRAGFELRRDTLNQVGRAALLMSAVPAIFEIVAVVVVAPPLLHITYLEAALLASILAAVSPAVVVPLMIDLMDRGMGSKKGIPTLVLGASSVDDVFVIVVFSVFLGMYGGTEVNLWMKLGEIPLSIILGIVVGVIPGYILSKLFVKYDWKPPRRTIIVIGTAIVLTWIEYVSEKWIPVASLIGVMAIGFVILERAEPVAHIISQKLKKVWVFAELLLFVLVGAQVNIDVAWDAGLAGAAVIGIGLVFRSMGTYLSLLGTPLNFRERIFCVVAYIPKATVQAAIGAVPLAAGVASGEVILAVAVLSILLTAPLGALGITLLGDRFLEAEEHPMYRFQALREKLDLPHVGERVRSKKFGTVWKVIEEKETWLENPAEKGVSGARHLPAVRLRYWKEDTSRGPGTGKTISYPYSRADGSFHDHWEVLYDW
jgi:NhaP-type Na+/H+ or K+/H+ antiporter